MENKFFTFIKPYLIFIDNGDMFRKPFAWVYKLLAVVNLIIPVYVLYRTLDSGIFNNDGKIVFVFLLVWLVIAFAGWISFQIWWDRSAKITYTSNSSDEYVATPVFAHFIQTAGEWIGTWIGIVGFLCALIITIFMGSEGNFLLSQVGISFINTGILAILLMPVYGFLIIIIARFFAEMAKALTSIANNTKKA